MFKDFIVLTYFWSQAWCFVSQRVSAYQGSKRSVGTWPVNSIKKLLYNFITANSGDPQGRHNHWTVVTLIAQREREIQEWVSLFPLGKPSAGMGVLIAPDLEDLWAHPPPHTVAAALCPPKQGPLGQIGRPSIGRIHAVKGNTMNYDGVKEGAERHRYAKEMKWDRAIGHWDVRGRWKNDESSLGCGCFLQGTPHLGRECW